MGVQSWPSGCDGRERYNAVSMEWKQPEGLRRHWVLEELDAELLFKHLPVGAAQGRVGDAVYELRDGGILRKTRTIAADGVVVAKLEERGAGGMSDLHAEGKIYRWKPASLIGNRWILEDEERRQIFAVTLKQGLAKVAQVEPGEGELPGPWLLLCWYVMVL